MAAGAGGDKPSPLRGRHAIHPQNVRANPGRFSHFHVIAGHSLSFWFHSGALIFASFCIILHHFVIILSLSMEPRRPWTTSAPLVRTVGADSQKRRRPTLLLRGDSDQIVTIDDRCLDQYELAYGHMLEAPAPLANTGHCFYLEEPGKTHELILAFLGRPIPEKGEKTGSVGGAARTKSKTEKGASLKPLKTSSVDGAVGVPKRPGSSAGGGGVGVSDEQLEGLLSAVEAGLDDSVAVVDGPPAAGGAASSVVL